MKTIYLVEDEKPLSELLTVYLKEAGYAVVTFDDGLAAKKHIKDTPDLWVLDIMLPGMDGYSLIREIKAYSPQVPVIFASARNAELDRVIGLELGSDDYLPKPFLPRELILRIERIFSYMPSTVQPDATDVNTVLGPYLFNRQKRTIDMTTGDSFESMTLSNKEYELLDYLISNQNQALSRNDLIDAVWGLDYFGSDRVVDDTIRRLRKKMPKLPLEPVYGFGYLLKGNLL